MVDLPSFDALQAFRAGVYRRLGARRDALFATMSSATGVLDTWLSVHDGLSRRIIVAAELKWEVRDKLDQANITERVLFPGLDGLATWLKRYFSPRSP